MLTAAPLSFDKIWGHQIAPTSIWFVARYGCHPTTSLLIAGAQRCRTEAVIAERLAWHSQQQNYTAVDEWRDQLRLRQDLSRIENRGHWRDL